MFAGSIMIAKLLAKLNKKIAFCTGRLQVPACDGASALPRKRKSKIRKRRVVDYLITTFWEIVLCPVVMVMKYIPLLHAAEGISKFVSALLPTAIS